jgi:threonine dehydrogenase-like Zn-dependent dehydrogenase
MRGLVYDKALAFRDDLPEPTPGEGECVIAVRLAGICATDHQITKGYAGFRGVLGHEWVGTVVSGSNRWLGKRVVCEINCVCRTCDLCRTGLSTHCRNRTVMGIVGRDGCFADLVAAPEMNLHEVPETLSDEEAVFAEPLAAAYQVMQQVRVDERTKVSVVGSGRLGLLVAQVLAKCGCALEVIGRNANTLAFCEKRGIQPRSVKDLSLRKDRDVVVECTGSPEGLELAMGLVRPRGTIVLKSTYAEGGVGTLSPVVVDEVTVVGSRCGPFSEALASLARRDVEVRSMVSRVFGLEKGLEAFEASADRGTIKVLLNIGR